MIIWLVIWAPLAFVSCLVGLLIGPLVSILAMGGLAAAGASLTIVSLSPGPSTVDTPGGRARTAGKRAGAAGAAVMLVGATIALLGAVALPVMALAVISSPPVVGVLRRHLKPAMPAHQHRKTRHVGQLGTERLCQEWRASYTRVSNAASVAALAEEAGRRQEYLDEMERRNAAGFRAWLETGPHAHDDPECFVHAKEPERSRRPKFRDESSRD